MPGYHDTIQHHHRLSPLSLDDIENYFAQLNPIAKRIAYDINDTKSNYGQLWNTLDYHEQNDIINDTLIKPEICLRYFDNFLTPTLSNSTLNSCQSSTASLTAIVFKDVSASRGNAADHKDSDKNTISSKRCDEKYKMNGVKHFYSYDGRNLRTFGMQKVAMKVIQDETLGCFRDEHSRPFCYRTKSQINLFILPTVVEPIAARKTIVRSKIEASNSKMTALISHEECPPDDEESKKTLDNYYRLQHQLRINLSEQKSHDQNNSTLSYTSIKPSTISTNRKIVKSAAVSNYIESKDKTSISRNSKSSMLQNYINSTQLTVTPKIGVNYAVFSDIYNTAEESSNLLQHCGQSDLTLGSCSSAATSDDDDKTLEEEDVHLLENDSNIRKGFDFLNNW